MHKNLRVLAILGLALTPACFCVTPAPVGQTSCNGVLVDTQADPLNCGVCGNPCLTGQKCSAGLCAFGGSSGGSSGGCTNGCSPVGATQCSGDGSHVQSCEVQGSGCLGWTNSAACAAGQSCVAGECSGAQAGIGAACTQTSDCKTGPSPSCIPQGNSSSSSYWPGGYCTSTCSSNADCGPNAACLSGFFSDQNGNLLSRCVEDCKSDPDCRAGYVCGTFNSIDFCAPACVSNAQCTSGQVCNASTGFCGASTCTPQCAGLSCGPDGCGGSCGSCTAGQACCGGTCYAADPTVGCADGTREGFADVGVFPAIAACAATWNVQSMQSPRTCKPCGNGLGACAAPEDACAFGWHLCMKNGAPNDLTTRVTMAQCNSASGGAASFVTGTSIFPSSANAGNCGAGTCTLPLPCTSGNWGASGLGYAPYCCGTGCMSDGCANCIYGTGPDYWAGNNEGCAQYASTGNDGVLCCKDPAVQ